MSPDTPSEKARPTAEPMERLRGLRDMAANPPVDRGANAPAWKLDAAALTAALDYIESMESIATDISEERDQAVARIRDLQAQEARLREALERIADFDLREHLHSGAAYQATAYEALSQIARAALSTSPVPAPAEARAEGERCDWRTSGLADTGQQPPSLQWECAVHGGRSWSQSPDGPPLGCENAGEPAPTDQAEEGGEDG